MISSRFRRSNMEFKNSRFHSDRDTIVGRRVVRGVYRGEDNGAIPHPRGGANLRRGKGGMIFGVHWTIKGKFFLLFVLSANIYNFLWKVIF